MLIHAGRDQNFSIDSVFVSTHELRYSPQVGVSVAIKGQSNNELLLSVKDLSNVDDERVSPCACQKKSSNFVREVIDMRCTCSAGGEEGFMSTVWLDGWRDRHNTRVDVGSTRNDSRP